MKAPNKLLKMHTRIHVLLSAKHAHACINNLHIKPWA